MLADTAKKGLPGDHHFFITFASTALYAALALRWTAGLLEREDLAGAFNLTAPAPLPEKELCQAVGAALRRPCWFPVPAILLTAKGFEVDSAAVGNLPICRVMTKPFSPRELLVTVQEALGLSVG